MSVRRIDMAGKKCGRLRVVDFAGNRSDMALWRCICDCGKEVTVLGKHLRSGETQSCGCLHSERSAAVCRRNRTKHGMSGSRTFRIWGLMLNRCRNPKADNYQWYGGRGISVCHSWHRFENFIADMGEAPKGKTLDRIDSDGNYEPSNCRWATKLVQANNTRTNRLLTVGGITKTMSEWAQETGVPVGTIHARLKRGWTDEQAVARIKA